MTDSVEVKKYKSRLNVGWAASPRGVHCLSCIYQHTHYITDMALQITESFEGSEVDYSTYGGQSGSGVEEPG